MPVRWFSRWVGPDERFVYLHLGIYYHVLANGTENNLKSSERSAAIVFSELRPETKKSDKHIGVYELRPEFFPNDLLMR